MIDFYNINEIRPSGDTQIGYDPRQDLYYYVRISYDRREDFYEINIIEEADRGGYHQTSVVEPVYAYSQDDAIDAAWDLLDEFQASH